MAFGTASLTFLAYESIGSIVDAVMRESTEVQTEAAGYYIEHRPLPGVLVLNLVQNSFIFSCGD